VYPIYKIPNYQQPLKVFDMLWTGSGVLQAIGETQIWYDVIDIVEDYPSLSTLWEGGKYPIYNIVFFIWRVVILGWI